MTRHTVSKSSVLLALVSTLALSTPLCVRAEIGNMFGKKKEASATAADAGLSLDSFSKSSNDAAGQVLAARIMFLSAQAKLMEALGLKTDAVVKASEALRAKEGAATKAGDKVDALKDSSKTTAEANKQMDEALAKSQNLSDESKAKFAEGSGNFIEGVLLEKAQIENISRLTEQGKTLAASAGIMEKMKVAGMVKPVTTLASMVPGDVKEGTTTLGKIMKFARSQNITNIPNSDKATASLGEL